MLLISVKTSNQMGYSKKNQTRRVEDMEFRRELLEK